MMQNDKKSCGSSDTELLVNLGITGNNTLDEYWVPEEDGMWFKPVRLDTIRNYYTAFWFCDRDFSGGYHTHSGSTEGLCLQGKVIFTDAKNSITTVNANQHVYIPPHVVHRAEIKIEHHQFLFYGTIEGDITYLHEDNSLGNKLNVHDYIRLAREHYKSNDLSIELLNNIIKC
jgi:mannose-6-phosphate isomerase-like protein (cupin superfamily)